MHYTFYTVYNIPITINYYLLFIPPHKCHWVQVPTLIINLQELC